MAELNELEQDELNERLAGAEHVPLHQPAGTSKVEDSESFTFTPGLNSDLLSQSGSWTRRTRRRDSSRNYKRHLQCNSLDPPTFPFLLRLSTLSSLFHTFFVFAFDVSDYLPLYYHPGLSFRFIVSLVATTISSTVAIPCTSYSHGRYSMPRTPQTALAMFIGDRPSPFLRSIHCTSQVIEELSLYTDVHAGDDVIKT